MIYIKYKNNDNFLDYWQSLDVFGYIRILLRYKVYYSSSTFDFIKLSNAHDV